MRNKPLLIAVGVVMIALGAPIAWINYNEVARLMATTYDWWSLHNARWWMWAGVWSLAIGFGISVFGAISLLARKVPAASCECR